MPAEPQTFEEGIEVAKSLRIEYDVESKRLKKKYLDYVVLLKNTFGTSKTARGLGVSRHRIYQVEHEAEELENELEKI